MKPSFSLSAFPAVLIGAAGVFLSASQVFAQDAAAEEAAPTVPEVEGPFDSPEARRAYAIGMYFGERARAAAGEDRAVDVDAVLQGVRDVLGGDKSLDYALGVGIGQTLKRDEVAADVEILAQGMRDLLGGGETQLGEEAVREEIAALQNEMRQRQMAQRQKEQDAWEAEMQEAAEKNREEGEKFLAANAKADGVQVTESGLQYTVLEPGAEDGEQPDGGDRVTVHYKGSLLDGEVFDQSPEGQPRTFAANRVIQGWQEGLQLMREGAKYRFWIPGDLAYGMRPPRVGGPIEAMDTLVFDVELVEVQDAPEAPTPSVGAQPGGPKRKPVTAVTPPVRVEIPPRKPKEDGETEGKPAEEDGATPDN